MGGFPADFPTNSGHLGMAEDGCYWDVLNGTFNIQLATKNGRQHQLKIPRKKPILQHERGIL